MSLSETLKKEWFVLLILLVPFVASFMLWDQLPEEVPTHFNIKGEADDWGPKWITAIMLPSIGVGVYALLLFLPLIDPKKKITSVQKPVAAIRMFTSIFLVGIYVFVMAASLGSEIDFSSYMLTAVGALILILGNYMNSIKPNYFIGVKTPWTLESPEVWKKTHRLTSKLWILGGLFMMGASFVPLFTNSAYLITVLVAVLAGIPIIYSYLIFQKIQKNDDYD